MFYRIAVSLLLCFVLILCPFALDYYSESDEKEFFTPVENVSIEETQSEPDEIPLPVMIGYVVSKTAVNVRRGAGTGYGIVATLEKGQTVSLRGYENGWYETVYKGKRGYVNKSYVDVFYIESANEVAESVIKTGESLLGYKYVYGAERVLTESGKKNPSFNPTLYDCSSLTQYCYFEGAGIVLGATTRTQYYDGKRITFEELGRGDLMLFTNSSRYYNTGIERIGHVAIYLGDGYILHTASDFARIEKLSATRKKNFITGVRVIE